MGMIAPINISNDPATGLARKAQWCTIADYNSDSILVISFKVSYYNSSGVEINTAGVGQYKVDLIADNSIPVKSDGSFSFNADGSPDWATGAVGQYDFIKAAVNAGASVVTQIGRAHV